MKRRRKPAPPARRPTSEPEQPAPTFNVADLLIAAVARFGYPVASGGVAIVVRPLDVEMELDAEAYADGNVAVGIRPKVADEPTPDASSTLAKLEARNAELEARVDKLTAALEKALKVPSVDDNEVDEMIASGRTS